MALKDNLYYWRFSLANPELPGEELYTRDVIIVNRDEYCAAVNRLRELIIAYCTLIEINKENEMCIKILHMIDELIIYTENIQYTEFVAYWKCLDMTYSGYKAVDEQVRLTVLRALLDRYCEQRRKLYDQLGYTHVIQQALYDSGSVRSQGETGVRKVRQVLNSVAGKIVPSVSSVEEFTRSELCVYLPDKGAQSIFKQFMEYLGAQYPFGRTHQGKLPDVLIKIGSIMLVLEAKHIKEPGGAQDKQISELIDYIRQQEAVPIHYVAFLDGLYFNLFQEPAEGTKPNRQRQDIETSLSQFKQNYFVNTAGLSELLSDAYRDLLRIEGVREASESIYRPSTLFNPHD